MMEVMSIFYRVYAQLSTDCSSYLESFNLILESVVLRLQVLHSMLGLAELCFQLSLQLPAPLLKLQQLLLSLLTAVGTQKAIRRQVETERGRRASLGDTAGGCIHQTLQLVLFLSPLHLLWALEI